MSRQQDRALVALARTQAGLLTRDDLARTTGRPDELSRRVRSGLWQEVVPGIVMPATVDVKDEMVESAVMLWDPRSLLSHHSAARRDGIWVPDTDRVWATTDFESTRRSRAGLEVVRTRHLPDRFRTDGFHRWTRADRTLVDLSQCLTHRQLEAVLLSAIRVGRTTAADVVKATEGLRGRAGLQLLDSVTSLWTPDRESLLEDLLFGDVTSVVSQGATRQREFHDRDGRLFARLDVAIEELRLGFEADGLLFHSTDQQIASDQRRDRRFLGRGWLIVRFREGPLNDRSTVRREIREIVEQRRRDLRAA